MALEKSTSLEQKKSETFEEKHTGSESSRSQYSKGELEIKPVEQTNSAEEKLAKYEKVCESVKTAKGKRQAVISFKRISEAKDAKVLTQTESKLDKNIAKMHEELKILAKDLSLDGFDELFLKAQMHETTFYLKHPELVHMQQSHNDCGFVCTMMIEAEKLPPPDPDRALVKGDRLVGPFAACHVSNLYNKFRVFNPNLYKGTNKGETATFTYPVVLKFLEHPVAYELAREKNIVQEKQQITRTHDEEYYFHMKKDPKEITVDQLKNAIGRKDKDGRIIPVMAILTRGSGENRISHVVLLDGKYETPEGEEMVVIRDPKDPVTPPDKSDTSESEKPWPNSHLGKLLTNNQGRSWKDFLEVWSGEAVIPVVESDPEKSDRGK